MEKGETFHNGGSGSKRKIDDEIEVAKQKAQAIAARFLNDADSKRPRLVTPDSYAPNPPAFPLSQPSYSVPYATQTYQYNGVPSSKKILIPNAKVGVIIGRGGDMIKNLQQRSGARIQITRDADADPTSLSRDVELMGTQEQISRAEEFINEVIAETDAAGSGPSGNRSVAPLQPGSEQFVMKVPNDKVALVIGKGGETIKTMQSNTGARIQVVPLHLPPGDTSTERNVFVNGTSDQIEAAKELINEVISGNRLKVTGTTNAYVQSAYQPTGWPTQAQPPAYGYTQPSAYPMPPPAYYSGYPSQPTGWEQQTTPGSTAPQQPNAGFNPYGQQAQPTSNPPNVNYNYTQIPPPPPPCGYNYNQGYPQQPPYAQQDTLGQTPPAPTAYGQPPTTAQTDGTTASQTSQPGYGTPGLQTSQPDGTTVISPTPSTYATGYQQTAANDYGAYPSYSAAPPPPVQPGYSETGYPQMGYGQVSNQASSYSYYGQAVGYQPTQTPGQSGYYQGSYPPIPPPQGQSQSQAANGGDPTTAPEGGVTTRS